MPERCWQTRVLFTCDMLLSAAQSQGDAADAREWLATSCAEPDDFQALLERRWSIVTDFKADEPVVLWRPDASEPPTEKNGYVRSGKVVKVVLAGESCDDPEAKRYDFRPRVGRKPQERYHTDVRGVCEENKVVLCVCAEAGHAVPWTALPELHL